MRASFVCGDELAEHTAEVDEHRLDPIEVGPDRRAEVVGRAAAPERDAVVRRPLAVDDQVPSVGHRLAAGPSDLVPDLGRERLGREHQRVDRHDRAARPGERRGPRLGRADDDVGSDGAVLRAQRAPVDRLHACLLEERDAGALDDVGEAAREPGRMDRRAVRGVRRAELADDVDAVAGGGGVEPSFVVVGEAERVRFVDPGVQATDVGRVRGEVGRAALDEVAVDPFVGADLADLVDRVEHRPLHRDRCRSSVLARDPR